MTRSAGVMLTHPAFAADRGNRRSVQQRILLIAPHPLFQERGTPIATRLLLQALTARGAVVDVATYHEGQPICLPRVTIHRIPVVLGTRNVRPGWSLKKLVCDGFLFGKALGLLLRNRRYHVLHGIEEGAFMAQMLGAIFRIPYVYDMDSSLVQQMTVNIPMLAPIRPLLEGCVRSLVHRASVVVPVCEALAQEIAPYRPQRVEVLRDISLIEPDGAGGRGGAWREKLGLHGIVVLYAGNFERYQGIDLLLESFAQLPRQQGPVHLVLVGGASNHLAHYQNEARRLGIESQVRFLGPQPMDQLGEYLKGADILVSPRIEGENTPMKIYSYMHSATPIVATNLSTHTQVLDESLAMLVAPQAEPFAGALARLIEDEALRRRLGLAAQKRAQERHSPEAFAQAVDRIFDALPPYMNNGTDR